jgi:hypothetical protein
MHSDTILHEPNFQPTSTHFGPNLSTPKLSCLLSGFRGNQREAEAEQPRDRGRYSEHFSKGHQAHSVKSCAAEIIQVDTKRPIFIR